MANPEHLAKLNEGVEAWNRWREENPAIECDLSQADLARTTLAAADLCGANLYRANLYKADLNRANLSDTNLSVATLAEANAAAANLVRANLYGANLSKASLTQAMLSEADLSRANVASANLERAVLIGARLRTATLSGADLREADLSNAEFSGADLREADLSKTVLSRAKLSGARLAMAYLRAADVRGADLSGVNLFGSDLTRARLAGADLTDANLLYADLTAADLSGANLSMARLVSTDLSASTLSDADVYGISAWDVKLPPREKMRNLRITPSDQPAVTVDNLEVAQFLYLMLHNEKIRDVIDSITGRGVLILGRFYEQRKKVLDALRDRLRELNFVPMVFDWDKPTNRDLTETVQLLANMSRFVIADITDAKSIPQELASIVPRLPSVPVRPIILETEYEYSMFEHWEGYNTMLPVHRYRDQAQLIEGIREAVIEPVEQWEAGYDEKRVLREEKAALEEEVRRLRRKLGET